MNRNVKNTYQSDDFYDKKCFLEDTSIPQRKGWSVDNKIKRSKIRKTAFEKYVEASATGSPAFNDNDVMIWEPPNQS